MFVLVAYCFKLRVFFGVSSALCAVCCVLCVVVCWLLLVVCRLLD